LSEQTSNWHKLTHLKCSQWVVIVQSPFVLLLTWIRLRRGGYQKTLDRIVMGPEPVLPPEQQLIMAKEVAFALAIAVKAGPWRPQCLVRSLALGWFLARRSIPFYIRIGVPHEKFNAGENGEVNFSAHAWVEHAGVVLNDRQDIAEQFSAFDTGSGSA
jgi:hypothetical protein